MVLPAAGTGLEPGQVVRGARASTPRSLLPRLPDLPVLYTDGLVEVPSRSLDDGIDRLVGTVSQCRPADSDDLCRAVLAGMLTDPLRDDVALLAVGIGSASRDPQGDAIPEPTETAVVEGRPTAPAAG